MAAGTPVTSTRYSESFLFVAREEPRRLSAAALRVGMTKRRAASTRATWLPPVHLFVIDAFRSQPTTVANHIPARKCLVRDSLRHTPTSGPLPL